MEAERPLTIERLERALALAAFVVLEHGEAYTPVLERLEREVEAMRRNDPKSRASRILQAYRPSENGSMILLSQS